MKTLKSLPLWLLACLLAACSPQAAGPVIIPVSTPTGGPRPTPTASPFNSLPFVVPTPFPWASLDVTGQLIFPRGRQGIAKLDLASGTLTDLFRPPERTWTSTAAMSPDGTQLVMTYAPPPPEDQPQLGFTGLYLLPADGAGTPQPLLEPTQPFETYFWCVWAPDGRHIYYVRAVPVDTGEGRGYKFVIERITYPGGEPQVLVEHALWLAVSPDGAKISYVRIDPATSANDLYLANADGSDPVRLLAPGTFLAVDAPLFSPDGQSILFSATGDIPAPALTWLDDLLGVQVASAHSVPSDWWRVPVAGGQPVRLTELYTTGLSADFSPDDRHLAFLSAEGLFLMNPDGTVVLPILPYAGGFGTLDWIP